MAKMKKVLAIAMAAAMGMSMLAGCGGQGKDDVTEATSQAETSEAATRISHPYMVDTQYSPVLESVQEREMICGQR